MTTPLPGQQSSAGQRDGGEVIVVCPDGPLLVRGDFDIISTTGEPVPRGRRTVALCRCGGSAIKPYCDGTHKVNGFRTEAGTLSKTGAERKNTEKQGPEREGRSGTDTAGDAPA